MNISLMLQSSTGISQTLEKIETDIQSGNIYKVLIALETIEQVQKQVESIISDTESKNTFLQRIKNINTDILKILEHSKEEIEKQIRILEKKEAQSAEKITQKKEVPQILKPIFSNSIAVPPPKIETIPHIDGVLGEHIKQFFIDHSENSYSLFDIQEIFGKNGLKTKIEIQNAFFLARAQLNKNGKVQLQNENGLYRYISKEKPKRVQKTKKTQIKQNRIKTVKIKGVREKVLKEKVPVSKENELSETEKMKVEVGNFEIQTIKSEGRGKAQKYFVQINEKLLEFTPSQYDLFKVLCETEGTLELEKNKIPKLRIIKIFLTDSGFGELANLLGEKRKEKEKIVREKVLKEKIVKIKVPKNTDVFLSEGEKLDTQVGKYSIKTSSVARVGKMKKEYIIQIGEKNISFFQGEYNLFHKFLTSENEKIQLKAEQYHYYDTIIGKLASIDAEELVNIFERKRKKREKKEKIVQETINKVLKIKNPKNTEIILSKTEKIDTRVGEYSIITSKAIGNGIKRKFHVQVGEKIIELTPFQNTLLKTLYETQEKITIEKDNFYAFHSLLKILETGELGELAKLLSEKRKMKEKIAKKKPIENIKPMTSHTSGGARIPYQKPVLKPDPLSSSTYSQAFSSLSKGNIEIDETFSLTLKNFLLENPGKNFSFMELYELFTLSSGKNFEQTRTALLLLKAQEENTGDGAFKITHGMIGYFPKVNGEDTKKPVGRILKEQRERISGKEKMPQKQKVQKEVSKKEILMRELDSSEKIESYVMGVKYTTLGKTLHVSITKYKIHIGNVLSHENEIILTQSEFKILFLLLQKKGKILKILPKYLPALRTLSKKLPENHIRNERGEGYYIGEYSPDIIHTNRRVAQIDNPLEKKDYTFETDSELQSTIIKIFKEHKGDFFTLEALGNTLSIPVEDTVKLRTQFLLAKSNYNNKKIQIIETSDGWTHIPDIFDSRLLFLGDLEVHYEEKYGALFSKNGDMIFQSKEIQKYLFVKKGRIYTKKSKIGSERIHLVDFFSTLNRKYPHLIIEKDGAITARREHDVKQKEKLRIANESHRKLLAAPSE